MGKYRNVEMTIQLTRERSSANTWRDGAWTNTFAGAFL